MSKKEQQPQVRNYKRAFEPGYDVENPPEIPRKDLTERQKNWLGRAWRWASIHILHMDQECIPNAFPIYNEEEGFAHRPGIKTHWHHIDPIGEATRIEGMTPKQYNNPRNIVPADALNHIGLGADDNDFVDHKDTMEANREYSLFKRGEVTENPYVKMGRERREKTSRGEIYHDDRYDDYLRDLADQVTTGYTNYALDDPFPE